MKARVKFEIQTKIDDAYRACDRIKDEIAVLNHRYNANLAYLEKMRDESGLCVSQSVANECMGL